MVFASTRCIQQYFRSPLIKTVGRNYCKSLGYSIVEPAVLGPTRQVPDRIVKPSYAKDGSYIPRLDKPEVKTAFQIERMRTACKLARHVLDKAGKSLKVGMTTDEIDKIVHDECIASNAYPSPLGYKGFPKSVCTSVNNVVCHGIPDMRPLEDGDIINIDVSVYFCGFHGDTSETFGVGNVDKEGKELLEVGRECLHKGIMVCKPGARFCDIGITISEHAHAKGYSVIPEIIGHGIGSYFHGPPDIFHVEYLDPETTLTMEPGMTFTIEPVISAGKEKFNKLADNWTLVSVDNSRACQFEHTVLITEAGVEVLTKWYTVYEEI